MVLSNVAGGTAASSVVHLLGPVCQPQAVVTTSGGQVSPAGVSQSAAQSLPDRAVNGYAMSGSAFSPVGRLWGARSIFVRGGGAGGGSSGPPRGRMVLPKPYQLQYAPALALVDKVNSWEDLQPHFNALLEREVHSPEELAQLILDLSDLYRVFDEPETLAVLDYARFTTDPAKREGRALFVGRIRPEVKKAVHAIQDKIIASEHYNKLPSRFDRLKLLWSRQRELYCEANLPLEAKLRDLEKRYDELTRIEIDFDGVMRPYRQAFQTYSSLPEEARRRVWLNMREAERKIAPELKRLFRQINAICHRMAKNAGYSGDTAGYFHARHGRQDFSTSDILKLHEAVEKHVAPLAREVQERQQRRLGRETLYPWDAKALASGQSLSRPYDSGEDLVDRTIQAVAKIDSRFGEALRLAKDSGNYDAEVRPDKANGEFIFPFYVRGLPFMFLSATGSRFSVSSGALHEAGHALDMLWGRDMDLFWYLSLEGPYEDVETKSFTMEAMARGAYEVFYQDPLDRARALREHMEETITSLVWFVTVDAFERWIYEHPHATDRQIERAFIGFAKKFGVQNENWVGLSKYRASRWLMQRHIFVSSFDYIKYAIARLFALQNYANYLQAEDKAAFIDGLLLASSLGNSVPLSEKHRVMGISGGFGDQAVQEAMRVVMTELGALYAEEERLTPKPV